MSINNCFLCGEYDSNEDAHIESIRHTKNLLKHSLEQRPNKKNLKLDEQVKLENDIIECEQTLEKMTSLEEYDCSKCGKCDFKSMNELEEHEVECFNYKRELDEIPKNNKKTYSSETATCERCGKVYLHTTKLLPKYALARHQKTCKGTLPYKQRVKDFMTTASEEQLKKLYDFMKTI
jgi:hypothetical protein